MSRFVDVDELLKKKRIIGTSNYCEYDVVFVKDIEEATTDEVIPKDQYEARLKADMVAMLTELQLEISELKSYESSDGQDLVMLADIGILFQQKINILRGNEDAR